MYNTTGLHALYLTEMFIKNYEEQLEQDISDKARKLLTDNLRGLRITLQTINN